jgi:hypothetical protein
MYGPSKLFKFPEIEASAIRGGKKKFGEVPQFFYYYDFFLLRPYTLVLEPSKLFKFPEIVNPPPSWSGTFPKFFFEKKWETFSQFFFKKLAVAPPNNVGV